MDEELTKGGGEEKYFTVKVDDTGQCTRRLTLEVTDDALLEEKARVVEKLRKDIEVPGFRKGKVPASYVSRNYDHLVKSDAVQNLLTRVYQLAIESEGLHPLAEPKFKNLKTEDGEGISVEADIEVKPEIEIEGYTDVTLEVEKRGIDGEKVQQTLQSIREGMAQYQTVERPAQSDDYVVIDFAPYLESGELDEKARKTNYGVSLESDHLLPEFRQGLVGSTVGDTKEILVRYPDDLPDKELAGKNKSFQVKVSEVKEKLLPDLDDAFAQSVSSEVESLEALKNRIREDLEKEDDDRHRHDVQEKVIDAIIERNPFEVPPAMVENYLDSIVEEDRRRRPQVDDEAARDKEVRELFREPAVRMVKRYFIMDAVAKQEKLTVSADEIERKYEALAEGTGRPIEEVRKMFRDPRHQRNLESDLLDQKVLNYLRENADIKVV
jgi:trigger factor